MEALVTIKASTEELDLLRRALIAHRTVENLIVDDSSHEPKRRRDARAEILHITDMLGKLGVRP